MFVLTLSVYAYTQAAAIALFGGMLNTRESCIEGGSGDFVVFVDSSSDFTATMNFVSQDTESVFCPAGGPRLFKEDPGSGCFVGGVCEGTCLQFADASICQAQSTPTPAPTVTPTEVITPSPTISPTTNSPTQGEVPTDPPTFPPTLSPGAPTITPTTSTTPTPGGTPAPAIVTPSPSMMIGPTVMPSTASPSMVPNLNPELPTVSPVTDAPSPTAIDTARPTECDPKKSKKSKKSMKSKKSSKKAGKGKGKGQFKVKKHKARNLKDKKVSDLCCNQNISKRVLLSQLATLFVSLRIRVTAPSLNEWER